MLESLRGDSEEDESAGIRKVFGGVRRHIGELFTEGGELFGKGFHEAKHRCVTEFAYGVRGNGDIVVTALCEGVSGTVAGVAEQVDDLHDLLPGRVADLLVVASVYHIGNSRSRHARFAGNIVNCRAFHRKSLYNIPFLVKREGRKGEIC